MFTLWENGLHISSGYPGTLGKTEVSSDPSVNPSKSYVVFIQFNQNFIILTCSKSFFGLGIFFANSNIR